MGMRSVRVSRDNVRRFLGGKNRDGTNTCVATAESQKMRYDL